MENAILNSKNSSVTPSKRKPKQREDSYSQDYSSSYESEEDYGEEGINPLAYVSSESSLS